MYRFRIAAGEKSGNCELRLVPHITGQVVVEPRSNREAGSLIRCSLVHPGLGYKIKENPAHVNKDGLAQTESEDDGKQRGHVPLTNLVQRT